MPLKKVLSLLVISIMPHAIASEANIKITNTWVQATDTNQKETVAYLSIKSDAVTKLVSVKSEVAHEVKFHDTSIDNHDKKVREVKSIDIPAGEIVELKPGGYQLVLKGLKKALTEGNKVDLTLKFESSTKQNGATISSNDSDLKWKANTKTSAEHSYEIRINAAVKKIVKIGS